MGFCFYGETVCFEFYLNICKAALQNWAIKQPICGSPYYSPCEYDYAELEDLLTKAYCGQAPMYCC